MRSLCQADWETSSQAEAEEARKVADEEQASEMGDGDGEDKAEGGTDQAGDTKDGGGLGRGAESPSPPVPIKTFTQPKEPDERTVWTPMRYEKEIAFLTTLILERQRFLENNPQYADGSEVIPPFWVNHMLENMQKNFERTPLQQDKIADDRKQGFKSGKISARKKGRFNAMLNEGCGIPKEDGGNASDAPPTKKNTSPNQGGRKMAEFVLATGSYDIDSLRIYLKCLEEGAHRRRREDEYWGWLKRKTGDTQSWGSEKVVYAQTRRKEQRQAANMFWKFGLPGWRIGARGTFSLRNWDGSRKLLSEFPGVCCGEWHGDRICGRNEDPLQMCEMCYKLEKVERWLCERCCRTDVSVCRNCPARQRAQGGRQARADQPACTPEEVENKKWKIFALYKARMTEDAFEDADKATCAAGVGSKFGGGTAYGRAAPFPGQALTATKKTMERKAQASRAAPSPARGTKRNWWRKS